MTWRLIQDDDAHWYMIPYEDVDAFHEWVMCPWDKEWTGKTFDDMRVDGPQAVLIKEWELI